jgi:hypothetical protein
MVMSYSEFTLADIQRLGITIREVPNLFASLKATELPQDQTERLIRYLPLALSLNTEKARSELLIAPMLFELKLRYPERMSVFSGIEFSVDAAAGLTGRCDYIVSRSPLQLSLTSPVCVLVEAKAENIIAGIPQCLAEMVAAQRFNAKAGVPEQPIYGVVTSGVQWRFLRLNGLQADVDQVEYSIQSPSAIVRILEQIILKA